MDTRDRRKLTPPEIRATMRAARDVIGVAEAFGLKPPASALLAIVGGRTLLRHHRRKHRRHHRETVSLGLSFTAVEKGRSRIMAPPITIGPTQDVSCKLAPVDQAGNPTTLTPTVVWTSSDPTVIQLQVAPDTLSALGVNLKAGTATITAHLPGDSGGVQPAISESGDVTVSAVPPPPATTVALGLTLAAVDKAPPPAQ